MSWPVFADKIENYFAISCIFKKLNSLYINTLVYKRILLSHVFISTQVHTRKKQWKPFLLSLL